MVIMYMIKKKKANTNLIKADHNRWIFIFHKYGISHKKFTWISVKNFLHRYKEIISQI